MAHRRFYIGLAVALTAGLVMVGLTPAHAEFFGCNTASVHVPRHLSGAGFSPYRARARYSHEFAARRAGRSVYIASRRWSRW